jgi:hypothetical protein
MEINSQKPSYIFAFSCVGLELLKGHVHLPCLLCLFCFDLVPLCIALPCLVYLALVIM